MFLINLTKNIKTSLIIIISLKKRIKKIVYGFLSQERTQIEEKEFKYARI